MKISILGGGVAGLTAAIALAKSGHDVDVYERHQKRTDAGAGIVCWPNATFVLGELGLEREIAACAGHPVRMSRFSEHGVPLGSLDIASLNDEMGHVSYSVLRSDLSRVLERNALDCGARIHYGCPVKLLQSASGRALITLNDGKQLSGDLILGADGRMRSVARAFVLGNNTPEYQGFVNWIGVFEGREPLFDDMTIRDIWGTGLRFGLVPVSPCVAYWAAAETRHNASNERKSDGKHSLVARFRQWPAPVLRMIDQTPAADIHKIFVHDHDPAGKWHRDNVLLLGDAAHAALPTSGQGACQAMEDAWHLAQMLDSYTDLQTLFKDFHDRRAAKTSGITLAGRALARSLFNEDPRASEERNQASVNTDFAAMASGMAKAWAAGLPIHV